MSVGKLALSHQEVDTSLNRGAMRISRHSKEEESSGEKRLRAPRHTIYTETIKRAGRRLLRLGSKTADDLVSRVAVGRHGATVHVKCSGGLGGIVAVQRAVIAAIARAAAQ